MQGDDGKQYSLTEDFSQHVWEEALCKLVSGHTER